MTATWPVGFARSSPRRKSHRTICGYRTDINRVWAGGNGRTKGKVSTDMAQTQTDPRDAWMTKLQAAQYFGVAEKTIDRLSARKQIQKTTRKLPGRGPFSIYNPEDLARIKETQAKPLEPFIVPANGSPESHAISPQPQAALVHALTTIAEGHLGKRRFWIITSFLNSMRNPV